jgi:glycosyltransferase involved in cell wall biosynthesis
VYLHGISIPADNILRSMISIAYNIFGLLFCIKYAHLIFVVNSSTRRYLLHQGVESERVVVTMNGVETKEIVNLKEKKIFDACFMGRLVKSKGVYDLLSIWKTVCSKRPNAKLAILGDGPERERLEKLIFETGLMTNITLFGFVTGDKKYRVLKSSKIFIFPSYLESWGISIAEAMACGLPVIAYNLSIYKEAFDNKIITVCLGDVEGMAKHVIYLLENPEIAIKIGETNREFVKKYDWKTIAEKELDVISNLINKQ